MSVIGKATQVFSSLSLFVTEGEKINHVSGRVPLYVHFSLYRALKPTFPWEGIILVPVSLGIIYL